MNRHLVPVPSVDEMVRMQVASIVYQKFAEDVIDGKVIHNVETDELMAAENLTSEFRDEAIAAYVRLLLQGERS